MSWYELQACPNRGEREPAGIEGKEARSGHLAGLGIEATSMASQARMRQVLLPLIIERDGTKPPAGRGTRCQRKSGLCECRC